jgi:uncharacterized glyoxalase superfamily metalloenzyme YdcJ
MTTMAFADPVQMQHRLFAELSTMFGKEVPLYDKSLLVNRVCNRAVCTLLGVLYPGFTVSDDELARTSGERHGAIRIGRPDEYRWIGRFFAAFGMEPHNFYDMTAVGTKSQPIIATAFRSVENPQHRVFTSLLQTSWFDASTRARIEALLATRSVFSPRARELVEKCERQGGLSWEDADALIREGTERIFRWTGRAREYGLYQDLCAAGFKIAADIACFESHHLNHLTPNTLCMDLYTSAMKFCMGEIDRERFRPRAERALLQLSRSADRDWMRLHFRHLDRADLDALRRDTQSASARDLAGLLDSLIQRLERDDLRLGALHHSRFKDTTEGPSEDTPILLRQDSYKALTEPVEFLNPDGTVLKATHTARFGEIEQRFYATTPAGRALYDRCLAHAEAVNEQCAELMDRDYNEYKNRYAAAFAPFPKTLRELLEQGLVYGLYAPTPRGLAARGSIRTTDRHELVRLGYAAVDGIRYEDFLPVSAAGIFASNLNQYGTASTAESRPTFSQAMLEDVLGRPIIDADSVYRGQEARSLLRTYLALGLMEQLDPMVRRTLEKAADGAQPPCASAARAGDRDDRAPARTPVPA